MTSAPLHKQLEQVHQRANEALHLLENDKTMPDLTSLRVEVEQLCQNAKALPIHEQQDILPLMKDVITTFDTLAATLEKQKDWLANELRQTNSSARANKAYLKASKDEAS